MARLFTSYADRTSWRMGRWSAFGRSLPALPSITSIGPRSSCPSAPIFFSMIPAACAMPGILLPERRLHDQRGPRDRLYVVESYYTITGAPPIIRLAYGRARSRPSPALSPPASAWRRPGGPEKLALSKTVDRGCGRGSPHHPEGGGHSLVIKATAKARPCMPWLMP